MRSVFNVDILVLLTPFLAAIFTAIVVYKWPRSKSIVGWFWVLVISVAIISPGLSVLAWHVQHGNHVTYGGKRFRVPPHWTASPFGTGIEIRKDDLTYLPNFIEQPSIEHIELEPRGIPRANVEERIAAWHHFVMRWPYRESDSPDSNVLIKSASGEIHCVRTLPNSLGSMAMATCLFVEDGWTADYMGRSSYLDTFFEILRTSDSP